MAKKNPTSPAAKMPAGKTSTPAVTTTPVRNTAVPPKSAAIASPAKKSAPTREAIELRAYFLWQSSGGSEFENWIRAERELAAL